MAVRSLRPVAPDGVDDAARTGMALAIDRCLAGFEARETGRIYYQEALQACRAARQDYQDAESALQAMRTTEAPKMPDAELHRTK